TAGPAFIIDLLTTSGLTGTAMAASKEPDRSTEAIESTLSRPPSSSEGWETVLPTSVPKTWALDSATAWLVTVSHTQPPRVPEAPTLTPPGTGLTRLDSGVGLRCSCTSTRTMIWLPRSFSNRNWVG